MNYLMMLGLLLLATPAFGEGKLVVYNWGNYLPNAVVAQFSKQYNITVETPNYDSNEAMYAKIKTVDGKGYDIIVPSTYYVQRMAREGLLHSIDHSKLPNLKHIRKDLLNQSFDPKNQYSIPYMWGTTALVVNPSLVKKPVTAWADLWDPAFKNQVLLLDDVRDVFGVALKTLGYSINTKDPKQIELAYKKLVALKPNVVAFNEDATQPVYLGEEASLGMDTSDAAYIVHKQNPTIEYRYPKEGPILWLDNFSIVKNTANLDNALKFINFILQPEIAAQIIKTIGGSTPNQTAVGLLPESMQHSPIINPGKDQLKKGEYETDLGEAMMIYEKYWQKLKSQ